MKNFLAAFALLAAPLAFAPAASANSATPGYTLKVEAPPAQKGQPAVAKILVVPAAGYHINKEFPTSLSLTAPAGVKLGKTHLGSKDAAKWEEKGGEFDVSYTAEKSGKVTGELKLAVCSSTSCDPKKTPVAFEVAVK